MDFSIDREKVLIKAIHDCLSELYYRAQPSANYDELLKQVKEGKIEDSEKNPIFKRYYISHDNMQYIVQKYIDAYHIDDKWFDYIELLEKYLKEGGYKSTYKTDEKGITSNELEKTKKLSEIIGEENANKVFNMIEECKNFYRFNIEESSFNFTIYLGCAPSSNKEDVEKRLKEQGIDIKIEDIPTDKLINQDLYGEDYEEEFEYNEENFNEETDELPNEEYHE